MKPLDFIKWLQGYLDALASVNEDLTRIEDKLWEVDVSEPNGWEPPKLGGYQPEDPRVPFHTLCGCRVCGCTMANNLVYPSNYKYTTGNTSDRSDIENM